MSKFKVKSEIKVNGRQVVPNQLLQAAFDLVGELLTGGTTTNRFSAIAILDTSQTLIATKPATFTASATSPGPGVEIAGSAIFLSGEVTSDVHYLELRDATGEPLARANLPVPLDSGESIVISRTDTFSQVSGS